MTGTPRNKKLAESPKPGESITWKMADQILDIGERWLGAFNQVKREREREVAMMKSWRTEAVPFLNPHPQNFSHSKSLFIQALLAPDIQLCAITILSHCIWYNGQESLSSLLR